MRIAAPAQKTQKKLKLKIKEMTKRKRFQDSPLLKISALNAVLRGWINYYRHSNVKRIAKNLDFWVNQRLFLWLVKRHKLTPRRIVKMYKLRENGQRYNLGVRNGQKYLFLYRLSDLPLTKYRSRSPENPYIQETWTTEITLVDFPLPEQVWKGNAENSHWRELKETIKAERGAKCEICGNMDNLDPYTISKPENIRVKMRWKIFNSFVVTVMLKHLRLVVKRNNDGKPNDEKLSRSVWGEE